MLRRWRVEDVDALAALRAHPEVIRWFPAATRAESIATIDRFEESFEELGFGRFAVEDRRTGAFLGWNGAMHAAAWAATPEKDEIGWLVDPSRWGEGLATEAATAALDDLFRRVGLERVIAFALPDNQASLRMMERCGMTRGGVGEWVGQPHVWYSIDRPQRARAEA